MFFIQTSPSNITTTPPFQMSAITLSASFLRTPEAAADDDFQAMPVVVFAARPPRQNSHAGQHHIGARHLRVARVARAAA